MFQPIPDDIQVLQFLTIILGLVSTIIPLRFAYLFWSDKDGIGRKLSYMLYGEAISMGIATYFAVNSFLEVYNTMPPVNSMYLRWMIFSTALFSTLKLWLYMKKLKSN